MVQDLNAYVSALVEIIALSCDEAFWGKFRGSGPPWSAKSRQEQPRAPFALDSEPSSRLDSSPSAASKRCEELLGYSIAPLVV